MNGDLHQAVRRLMPEVMTDLESLIRIPSVSADPAAAGEVRRSADMTAALFRDAGASDAAVLDDIEGGRPAGLIEHDRDSGTCRLEVRLARGVMT